MLRHAWILLIILLAPPALADDRPPAAAIASAHPLATEAGLEILEAGGNAFDAAIAVGAVLAVVEPASSGMGGGGFWLLHRQHDGLQTMLDARETAPAAASATMYQDKDGNVVRDHAINGPLAAGIPGQAAAFVHLAEHYGRLPLAQSLAPAIQIAREGFPVSERYRTLAGFRDEVLHRYPAASRIFLQDGKVPPAGHQIRQPDLARVLERIARAGHAGFYEGDTARDLVRGVRAAGGLWTLDDLASYTIKERAPIVSTFRGARIISAPPPSSGGIVLAETLNILAQFNDGDIAPELLPHLTVEAMKRAYRDRAEHLGDPDFVSMPVTRLLSVQHARELARGISLDKPTPSSELGAPLAQPAGTHTTHLSILDDEGNRVAATLSVNLPFGSGFVAEGTGILLNNEMDDFSSKPGSPNAYGLIGSHANAIAPGKRPLSSMTPTFVEWDDKVAILGTPGGSRIISMVLLGVQEALAGKPVTEWVSRPRYHHQYLPDVVEVEPAFIGSDEARLLEVRGHTLKSTGRTYGDMHAVLWEKEKGEVSAASDPRGEGSAHVSITSDPE
ncbi:gamma-glutamyltransferase [Isoalcanivorax pacificus W11-5]|uniref:Glutathione hydrolase proenzyme n=1 Tax=Isoalcanivorax pacificus W11-5 TaxID=391936 RepID=A0A0B4XHK0_9GAMM|nr:gamma-glutamyltransferase [Isoalcanivorax pacificus]AJD46531.1 gamma-glutamyltransferase [Isoalcanivorax pacificus W11-5]